MPYLVDTDVFIRAKNLHYGFDLCPGFWDWLASANDAGAVFSIERVLDELRAGDDELTDWANQNANLFLPPNQDTFAALSRVADWARQQEYRTTAIDTFVRGADSFLVAEALARGFGVVTHEIPSNSINRIKIPDICIGLGVRWLSPFEMLGIERARFVLETPT